MNVSEHPLFSLLPRSAGGAFDWPALYGAFEWVRALDGCIQDPIHHAEGDVWIHTQRVCEELTALPGWAYLSARDRRIVAAAALLHDLAKPACTRIEGERVSSRGHSGRGEILTRQILWQLGTDAAERESISALIRFHQQPFFLIDRDDRRKRCHRISQSARCDLLALLAEADARGRICADADRILTNVALFAELCRDEQCFDKPRAFASDHSRFLYFRKEGRDPDYQAHDDTRSLVIVMSGLPAAGKSTWVERHACGLDVVSLDQLRREMGVDPSRPQGEVIAAAREQARVLLRASRPFVWDATNLSRDVRRRVLDLLADYGAKVEIVCCETGYEELWRRNRQRSGRVPETVLTGLLDRWQVPDLTEAHAVSWHVS